ncbi:hypothetical protein X975_27164, partial [Stegodyphus mimosarum]
LHILHFKFFLKFAQLVKYFITHIWKIKEFRKEYQKDILQILSCFCRNQT